MYYQVFHKYLFEIFCVTFLIKRRLTFQILLLFYPNYWIITHYCGKPQRKVIYNIQSQWLSESVRLPKGNLGYIVSCFKSRSDMWLCGTVILSQFGRRTVGFSSVKHPSDFTVFSVCGDVHVWIIWACETVNIKIYF